MMSVLNYGHCGFECNYEMDGNTKTISDEFKNYIKKKNTLLIIQKKF